MSVHNYIKNYINIEKKIFPRSNASFILYYKEARYTINHVSSEGIEDYSNLYDDDDTITRHTLQNVHYKPGKYTTQNVTYKINQVNIKSY